MNRLVRALCCAASLLTACGAPTPAEELCLSASEQALSRICQGPTVVTGPDVSIYQGTVNWPQVKAAGHVFAIARVSDGSTHLDSQFNANWAGMKSAGLVRGVYQFFRPGQDPTAQANLLLAHVRAAGGFQPGDLPPVLDVESVDGQSTAVIRARIQVWLNVVERATNKRPIIYTAAFMNSVVGTGFAKYPLWVANYGPTCPTVPDAWSAWRMWQYTSTGAIHGISGNVDTNRFNGSLVQLKTFAAQVVDAGVVHVDAGVAHVDAGVAHVDAGVAHVDAGVAHVDAGVAHVDAGVAHVDAGVMQVDAGEEVVVDMTPDAGPEGATLGSGREVFIQTCGSAP